jgi:flagellar biosynthesis/type III secretory pathway chaperone
MAELITIFVTLIIIALGCAIGCIGGPIYYDMKMKRVLDAEEQRLAEQRLGEQRLAEQRLAEQRLAEQRLAEKRQADWLRRAEAIAEKQSETPTFYIGPFPEQDSDETEEEARIRRAREKMAKLRNFNIDNGIGQKY